LSLLVTTAVIRVLSIVNTETTQHFGRNGSSLESVPPKSKQRQKLPLVFNSVPKMKFGRLLAHCFTDVCVGTRCRRQYVKLSASAGTSRQIQLLPTTNCCYWSLFHWCICWY